jgi:hypothetical protein
MTDLPLLLAQLEAAKFRRLFHHMAERSEPRDNLSLPARPIGLPNTELLIKQVGEVSSLHSWATSWAFQAVHVPAGLWSSTSALRNLHNEMEGGMREFAALPNWSEILFSTELGRERTDLDPIPIDGSYYLFTNVSEGIDVEYMEEFARNARLIADEVFGLNISQRLNFGIATPAAMWEVEPDELTAFTVDLINMPSSYYLLALEGRITVTPMREHGEFVTACGSLGHGLAASASNASDDRRSPSPEALADFEQLLNSKGVKETDLHAFLEDHPEFLFALDERFCDVQSHVGLIDKLRPRLVPDFVARLDGTDPWTVIELKRPDHRIFASSGNVAKAAAPVARAISQLLEYRDTIATRRNRTALANAYGLGPYEPTLMVVIGRGNAHRKLTWHSHIRGIPDTDIVTYDFMFERARECSLLNQAKAGAGGSNNLTRHGP